MSLGWNSELDSELDWDEWGLRLSDEDWSIESDDDMPDTGSDPEPEGDSGDAEGIGWTEQVKAILLARFAALHQEQRSAVLETVEPGGEAGTVAGRTPVATLTKPDGALSTERETTDVIPIG